MTAGWVAAWIGGHITFMLVLIARRFLRTAIGE